MRIALVSLDQKWEDKKGNQAKCNLISQEIVENNSNIDLIIYPEMTLTAFSIANSELAESESTSESVSFFKALSIKTQTDHMFGLAVKNKDAQYLNRCCFINSEGDIKAKYDKMHTFSFAGESELYSRGESPVVFKTNDAEIGLSICFDLRFPSLYAFYRERCNLMINIANWPDIRKSHWLTLLRSRAIENQFFMIGVNRTGVDGTGLLYTPTSVIYDPLGEQVKPVFSKDEYAIYDIELNNTTDVRSKYPFANDLRTELYKEFK